MRSHKFINSLLYLIIQLVVKECKAKENNAGIKCFFVLFIDKHYISQVVHLKDTNMMPAISSRSERGILILETGADLAIYVTGLLRRRRNGLGGPGAKPPEKFLGPRPFIPWETPFFLGNALLEEETPSFNKSNAIQWPSDF